MYFRIERNNLELSLGLVKTLVCIQLGKMLWSSGAYLRSFSGAGRRLAPVSMGES